MNTVLPKFCSRIFLAGQYIAMASLLAQFTPDLIRGTLVLQHITELFTANTYHYKIRFKKLFPAKKPSTKLSFTPSCHERGTLNRAWQAVLHIVLVLVTK